MKISIIFSVLSNGGSFIAISPTRLKAQEIIYLFICSCIHNYSISGQMGHANR
jgi:hypothetical protein